MKTEIKEILDYMEGGEEILRLREQVKNLNGQEDPATLQGTIDSLHALIDQVDIQNQGHLGYYHLFLGCACHEQEDYRKATIHLKRALPELRESQNDKAVAHWLLSVNYSSSKEYDKARKELIKAERLSNAYKSTMQKRMEARLLDLFKDPIFDEVLPEPKFTLESDSLLSKLREQDP